MAEWFMSISMASSAQRDDIDSRQHEVLASWEAGYRGFRWLQQLVADGKAIKWRHDGFPTQCTAAARDVLPLISLLPASDEPPVIADCYCTPIGWLSKIQVDRNRIERCALDAQLTIEAWGRSRSAEFGASDFEGEIRGHQERARGPSQLRRVEP